VRYVPQDEGGLIAKFYVEGEGKVSVVIWDKPHLGDASCYQAVSVHPWLELCPIEVDVAWARALMRCRNTWVEGLMARYVADFRIVGRIWLQILKGTVWITPFWVRDDFPLFWREHVTTKAGTLLCAYATRSRRRRRFQCRSWKTALALSICQDNGVLFWCSGWNLLACMFIK